jgi:hypothetical protein
MSFLKSSTVMSAIVVCAMFLSLICEDISHNALANSLRFNRAGQAVRALRVGLMRVLAGPFVGE